MTAQPTAAKSLIAIVEDDEHVRQALHGLLRSVGLEVVSFSSAGEFLSAHPPARPDCLVLDVRLPGRSGLDFFGEYAKTHAGTPVIFISGHADIPMSVRAMKAGAVEFLTKPVRQQDLLDAVQAAIEKGRAGRSDEETSNRIRAAFQTLTPRERQVMALVAAGRLNKQIAQTIGASEATVKLHRGNVMRKMAAGSLAGLVRMADRLGLSPAKS
ncbi:MAG: response regulator [Rhizomicrobium sp.]